MITHEHGDHAGYVKQYLENGITCYMTQGTKDALKINHHRLCIIKANQELQIGSWRVLPFEIEHDVAEPVGFLLKSTQGYKVLYVTDTRYIKHKFKGITHMMLEVNYIYEQMQENVLNGKIHAQLASRIINSHFSLEHAVEMLKSNDLSELKEIHLIHLSNKNSNAQIIKEKIQEVAGVPVYIGGI